MVPALLGCAMQAKQVSRGDLLKDPADALAPPGAEALTLHHGNEYAMTIDGPRWADDISIYRAPEETSTVMSFYDRELRRSGWQTYHVFLTTEEDDAREWCKGPLSFRIGIDSPDSQIYGRYFEAGFRTVFMASISGRDTKLPCPYP